MRAGLARRASSLAFLHTLSYGTEFGSEAVEDSGFFSNAK